MVCKKSAVAKLKAQLQILQMPALYANRRISRRDSSGLNRSEQLSTGQVHSMP